MQQFKKGYVFDFTRCRQHSYDSWDATLQYFGLEANYNIMCTIVHSDRRNNDHHPQDWTDHRKKAHAIIINFSKVRSLNCMLTRRKKMSKGEQQVKTSIPWKVMSKREQQDWLDKENKDTYTGYIGEDHEVMRYKTVYTE